MGIKFLCPNGHKLHVKSFLASQRGVCPQCGEKFLVPAQSLPDIRVESLGTKESKRVSTATGGTSTKSSKSAKPTKTASITVPSEEFEDRQDLTEMTGTTTVPVQVEPVPAIVAAAGSEIATAPAASTAVEADPIAQAPSAQWYVRIASGEQFGPAHGDLMQHWLTEGRVAADSLVWREGWAEWAVAGNIFRQLAHEIASPATMTANIDAFEQGLAEQVESLVLPSQPASDPAPSADPSIKSRTKISPTVESRRQVKSYHRLALVGLVVAVLCLFPLLVYVLWR